MPTALSFTKSGLRTVGIDINEELVNKIKNKDFPLEDEPRYKEIFEQVIKNGKLTATTKMEEIVPNSQIILLSLSNLWMKYQVPDIQEMSF